PVPSRRICVEDCHALRCGLMVFCLGISFLFGVNVHVSSALLIVVDFVRDDFGLSRHYVSKNFCTVGGYATLELAGESSIDKMTLTAPVCHALVIFMTIHVQDFPDTNGDRKSGRRTLPIVAPEGSRIYMICLLPLLPLALTSIWSQGSYRSTGDWIRIDEDGVFL
ncbi:hypothetical protein K503DRAFT_704535, partial [Rhizopogon vinicolor AM-OR11-026]